MHKAGFVNIIGKPNVGKSTLMNQLVGERLSIITSKAQTTRHRILGIVNGKDFQIVYSDTPGYVNSTKYDLHKSMNDFVKTAFTDADVLLYLIDFTDKKENPDLEKRVLKAQCPVFVLLNKIDLAKDEKIVFEKISELAEKYPQANVSAISALEQFNTQNIFNLILENLPESPAFYDKDALTDKPERFFVAEIIREKIFENYKQEIPYSSEVSIQYFKDEPKIIKIEGEIFVERNTQKAIIIGHQGSQLKKISTKARKDLELFFEKKVYLRLNVKVKSDWRNNEKLLKSFGYKS